MYSLFLHSDLFHLLTSLGPYIFTIVKLPDILIPVSLHNDLLCLLLQFLAWHLFYLSIAKPTFFGFPLGWIILFPHFTFSLCVSLEWKLDYYRKNMVSIVFYPSKHCVPLVDSINLNLLWLFICKDLILLSYSFPSGCIIAFCFFPPLFLNIFVNWLFSIDIF